MWPILALAAVVLAGCSRSTEDQNSYRPPPPAVPPPGPEQDVAYRRKCLQDISCPAGEREAAIMDYVGAVYGEKGKVHLGGPDEGALLTASERQYVLGKFGVPVLRETSAYLRKAQGIFFRDLNYPKDPACAGEPVSLPPTFSSPALGSALVLHGRHGCGGNYADNFMKSGIELT